MHMCLLVILWPVLRSAHTNYEYLEEPIKDGIGQHDNTTTPVLTGKLRNNTLQQRRNQLQTTQEIRRPLRRRESMYMILVGEQ